MLTERKGEWAEDVVAGSEAEALGSHVGCLLSARVGGKAGRVQRVGGRLGRR